MKSRHSAVALGVALALATGMPLAAGYDSEKSGMKQDQQTGSDMSKEGMSKDSMSHDTGRSDSDRMTSQERMGQQEGRQFTVRDIEGRDIVNADNDSIGEIQQVVRSKADQQPHAVIAVGGFLGIGEKQVTIPLDHLQLKGDKLVAPLAATSDELKTRVEYDKSGFTELMDDQMVRIGWTDSMRRSDGEMAGRGGMEAEQFQSSAAGFGTMDVNRDGYLSKDEASVSSRLTQRWESADTNSDGRIDRSEFSAFEPYEDSMNRGQMRQDTPSQPGGAQRPGMQQKDMPGTDSNY